MRRPLQVSMDYLHRSVLIPYSVDHIASHSTVHEGAQYTSRVSEASGSSACSTKGHSPLCYKVRYGQMFVIAGMLMITLQSTRCF